MRYMPGLLRFLECMLHQLILLDVVVGFMVVNHTLANDLYGLKFFEHNCFAALCANAVGNMVHFFAVCQRGARCL